MSFMEKSADAPLPKEVMRADLFMDFYIPYNFGVARVEWVYLAGDDTNLRELRPLLVALLYARILIINAETRTKLFELIDNISKQNIRDEGKSGFTFPQWNLHVGFGVKDQTIWPWGVVDSYLEMSECKPKVYNATLLFLGPGQDQWGIDLKMEWGQERILVPASILIMITSYAKSADQEGRYYLALLLWQINEFYHSANRVHIGSESNALKAAMTAIRSGNLRVPE